MLCRLDAATREAYETAKLLIANGLTYVEAAKKVGVPLNNLRQYAHRKGWSAQIMASRATLSSEVAVKVGRTLDVRAKEFVELMAEDAETTLKHAATLKKPKKWHEMAMRESAMEKLNNRGRVTFGLDQGGGNTTMVNVEKMAIVLGSCHSPGENNMTISEEGEKGQ